MISNTHIDFERRLAMNGLSIDSSGLSPSGLIDDSTPAEDIQLYVEMEDALSELDIISLRNKLKDINKHTGVPSSDEHSMDAGAYFGLSEELFNPVRLSVENEGNEIGNYLQKLHIKNYSIASKEQVHDLVTEGSDMVEMDHLLMSPEDEILFGEIKDAVTEREILDLRANLQSIVQSISIHEHTFEEIEDLVTGELDHEIANKLREEAKMNTALSFEIDLQEEINNAIEEQDIMSLRSSLKGLIRNEYSHSHNAEEIDSYLNDELDEHALALFEDELMVNSGLVADLAFHKEVNKAIAETDVMALRASLKDVSITHQNQPGEKLGVISPKRKNLFWYAAASVILLMFVVTSLMRGKIYSNQQLYTAYYHPYTEVENVSRSVGGAYGSMSSALREIDHGDFHTALKYLDNVPANEQDGFSTHFYSGVAYQELGEYNRAITSFAKVIRHGDNLLVEQSEWYMGLCYLRVDEREKALAQFKAIVSRKGFYGEQSGKLLKQLE